MSDTRQGFENACGIAGFVEILRILGECPLIASLPDKASRTLVELRGLPRYREY